MQPNPSTPDLRIPLALFAGACLVLLVISSLPSGAASVGSAGPSDRQKEHASLAEIQEFGKEVDFESVPVKNMTQAFRLISREKTASMVRLTLANGYNKRITALWLSVGGVGTQVGPIYNPEQMIPPQGVYVTELPLQPQMETKGIKIVAVIFDDGTADGHPDSVRAMRETELGEKAQLRRALALIQEYLRSPDSDTSAGPETLESQVKALPTQREGNKRGDYEHGLYRQKQLIVGTIQRIRSQQYHTTLQAGDDPRYQHSTQTKSKMALLIKEYERILALP